MYNIDCGRSMRAEEFAIGYFQFGRKSGRGLDKQRVSRRAPFHSEEHMGIKVNCSEVSLFTLRQLLMESA